MNGKDGKPFKTREGGVMRLENLIREINEEMFTEDRGESQCREIKMHRRLPRLSDLLQLNMETCPIRLRKDYIFDIDRFTSFEGNTGPYILVYNRSYQIYPESFYRKRRRSRGRCNRLVTVNDSEKNLMLQLTGFGATVENAFEEKAPHKICAYIYEVSNAFNSFYHETKILSEEDEAQKASFIQLLKLTKKVLETCIDLLGFSAPDRM